MSHCTGGNTHTHSHQYRPDEPQQLIISNRPARRRWYGRRTPASTVTFGPSSDRHASAEFAAREMTAGNIVYVATGFGAVWREIS